MKIERSEVTKLVITDIPRLDPVTVFAEDIGPRQGKIVIECYGRSWSAYWGGMGERSIVEFFCSCNVGYIADRMTTERPTIVDETSIKEGALRKVIELRRGQFLRNGHRIGRDEITREKARELWDDVDCASFGHDGWGESKLLGEIFGDEWWYSLPDKPNPNYEYLCRIIRAVQAALEETMKEPTNG